MKGSEFAERRRLLGLTQKELADMWQLNQSTIHRYEKGLMDIPRMQELLINHMVKDSIMEEMKKSLQTH